MRIDPHVHCRDGEQSYKGTIAHTFEVADKQGVKKIFDMPNTDSPVLNEGDIKRRLDLVPGDRKSDYYLYIGATSDNDQLGEAVGCWVYFPEIVGIKLFAGKSVGNLAVTEPEEQEFIYATLSGLDYDGVLAVHCEKESLMNPELFDSRNPVTHCEARPKEAEIESVKDQIKYAKRTDFKGVLHICHTSCPESVELINEAKKDMKATCGVTPHHILWDNSMLERPDGLLYKMNPPLRDYEDVEKLRKLLKEGKIDWIESDHAPHTIGEKLHDDYLSGYPSLYLYSDLVDTYLPRLGLSQKQIRKLTCDNIREAFELK